MKAKVTHVPHIETKPGKAIGTTRYSGYALVRDKDGNPRIDDPSQLHPIQINMLTSAEKQLLGMWDGIYGRDADGWKRLRQYGPEQYVADDPIRALAELVLEDRVYRVEPRVDLSVGQSVTVRRT